MTRLAPSRAAVLTLLAGLAVPALADPSPNLVGPPAMAPNSPAPNLPVQSAPPQSAPVPGSTAQSPAPTPEASPVQPSLAPPSPAPPPVAAAPTTPAPGVAVQNAPAPTPTAPAPSAPPSTEEAPRYSFHRMGDGFVRLDARTGQLAQCGWGPGGWSCKTVPDERAAFENEIGRLQRENSELKKSMLDRGLELPPGVVAEAPVPPPVPPANIPDPSPKESKEPKAPSAADLDRAMSFMKNVWRKLVDMMVDLQRDIQKKS